MSVKKIALSVIALSLCSTLLIAQKKALPVKNVAVPSTDATLFTYGGKPVSKNEFLRMYTKNINNQKPDFSEKALREYVTLYSRFKMKVAEAEQMKMDTLPQIVSELNGYKKTLSKTYLSDKDMIDNLSKEAYERMKKDVHVAHILISTPSGGGDTTVAYRMIDSIYKAVSTGKIKFEDAARSASADKGSAANGGDIGFITSMQVVYPFETVAYQTPIGSISAPFKTVFGYHIVKKIEERQARGEIQVAQIMLQVQKANTPEENEAIRQRADSIYAQLKKGADFTGLVKKHSQDKFSVNSDGVIAPFKTGQMVLEFENAAFNLKKAGDISEPIKTNYGYHIIKLISKSGVKPFDTLKQELAKKIEQDGRMEVAKQTYLTKVKKSLGYKENMNAVNELINAIPDSVMRNGSFKASDFKNMQANLFELKSTKFNQADFANYIQTTTGGRIYGGKEIALQSLFKNYSEKAVLDYQENRLMVENEEYRNLTNEYKDGIMLFELTDRSVWTKASSDTTGLDVFYNKNKTKYMWGPSINADYYKAVSETYANNVVKELQTNPSNTFEQTTKAVNGDGAQDKVSAESGKFEMSKFPKNIQYNKGQPTSAFKNEEGNYCVLYVKDVMNTPSEKTLNEAKGYVISEYQEYLEKEWIASLENKYPVKLNEQILKSLVKK